MGCDVGFSLVKLLREGEKRRKEKNQKSQSGGPDWDYGKIYNNPFGN